MSEYAIEVEGLAELGREQRVHRFAGRRRVFRLVRDGSKRHHFPTAIITTIDAAGRVVIPKRLREALRLLANTRLRVTEQGGCIVVEPEEEAAVVVERDGLTLIGGELVGPPPEVRRVREERLDELSRRATRRRRS